MTRIHEAAYKAPSSPKKIINNLVKLLATVRSTKPRGIVIFSRERRMYRETIIRRLDFSEKKGKTFRRPFGSGTTDLSVSAVNKAVQYTQAAFQMSVARKRKSITIK